MVAEVWEGWAHSSLVGLSLCVCSNVDNMRISGVIGVILVVLGRELV